VDAFIFLLALHWRKVLALVAAAALIGYLRSCFGG
jgi:hypothetical protein